MAHYRTADATAPFFRAAAITPSDVTVIENTRGIYVGGAGNVAVKLAESPAAVNLVAVPVGTILPIQAIMVLATGTTATNLIALY